MPQMKDILWSNVPQTLKNNELIEGYINAIGEEFEQIRQDIKQQSYSNDYAKSKDQWLNDITNNFGITYPRNVKNDPKRLLIRDAPDIISRLGTRKALDWVLKFIGIWEYEIGEVWVPNPGRLKQGYYKAIGDSNEIRYDVNSSSFQDFYIGDAVVKENGVFFEGYPYQGDPDTSFVTDIPIYGETYNDVSQISFNDVVSKTPYVVVRAKDYDWSRIIETVDEEDLGDSDQTDALLREQNIIISNLVNYFVQTLQRTATTRILLILDALFSTDSIKEIIDNLDITYTDQPIEYDEQLKQIDDLLQSEGYVQADQQNMIIGNHLPISGRMPHISSTFYSKLTIEDYTNGAVIQHPINFNERIVDYTSVFIGIGEPNQEHFVWTDIVPTVSFTAPSDSDVEIVRRRNGLETQESSIGIVTAGNTFNQTLADYTNAVILRFQSPTVETVNINVTYN